MFCMSVWMNVWMTCNQYLFINPDSERIFCWFVGQINGWVLDYWIVAGLYCCITLFSTFSSCVFINHSHALSLPYAKSWKILRDVLPSTKITCIQTYMFNTFNKSLCNEFQIKCWITPIPWHHIPNILYF